MGRVERRIGPGAGVARAGSRRRRGAGLPRWASPCLSVLLMLPLCGFRMAEPARADTRSAERHVHGTGSMTVLRDGDTLQVRLESAVFDLVGFEHAPQTSAQAQAWADVLAGLRERAAPLVRPNAAARCALAGVDVEDPFVAAPGHDRDAPAQAPDPASPGSAAEATVDTAPAEHAHSAPSHDHADVHVTYRFDCTRMEKLRELDVALFEAFPGLERLEAVYLDRQRQSGALLTPGRSRFRW